MNWTGWSLNGWKASGQSGGKTPQRQNMLKNIMSKCCGVKLNLFWRSNRKF